MDKKQDEQCCACDDADAKSILKTMRDYRSSDEMGGTSQYAESSEDDLKKTSSGYDPESAEELGYVTKKHCVEIERLEADNKRRNSFFRFVLSTTGIPMLVASGALITYICAGGRSDSVLIGYFASVVAQSIGLSALVANYLFPRSGSIGTNKETRK